MIRSPRNLDELCHLYECDHEKQECRYCAEGVHSMDERLRDNDIVKFSLGREVTGREFSKSFAGDTLTKLARQEAARKKCSFSEALHAITSTICPGERDAYLGLRQLAITDDSRLLPRGIGKKMTEIVFDAASGWTLPGVNDWLREQGFSGQVVSTAAGWTFTPDPGKDAFPR